MDWTIKMSAWRWSMAFSAIGGAVLVGLLWWALADLALASVEVATLKELAARWWGRDGEPPDQDDTGTPVGA